MVQPGDGIAPLLAGIESAKKTIEIVIFRFDRGEIEKALKAAASRGVFVHALIAYTNRGGEKNLRKLEMRLLEAGVTVARTANNLARYHDKFMIIDRRLLYLQAFNYTYLDTDHSRSFGIITKNHHLVQEAVRLFEADTTRQPYTPALDTFIVSPANARQQLAKFINGAQKQLLIYDGKLNDSQMISLLQSRRNAGVEIKVIGRIGKRGVGIEVGKLPRLQLHVQLIIRDGSRAFLGSQSLRKSELDTRREVGVIIRDAKAVKCFLANFEADWALVELAKTQSTTINEGDMTATKAAKKAVKAIANDLPALMPIVKEAVKEVVAEPGRASPSVEEVSEAVKEAVKEAVRETVKEAVEEVVEQSTTTR